MGFHHVKSSPLLLLLLIATAAMLPAIVLSSAIHAQPSSLERSLLVTADSATSVDSDDDSAAASTKDVPREDTSKCTAPRSHKDTTKPFCWTPAYLSERARSFLSTTAAGTLPFQALLTEGCTSRSAGKASKCLSNVRQAWRSVFGGDSLAAAGALLQRFQGWRTFALRDTSMAGVPVTFAYPQGLEVNSSAVPADTKLLMYLHGGGHIMGGCDHMWSIPLPTAYYAGLTVLCVEYRLAPEHPYPAAVHDALAVYKELLKQGYNPEQIVFLGDSAGGGLATATIIQLQREQLPLPAALGLFSPWTNLHASRPSEAGPQNVNEAALDSHVTLVAVDPIQSSGELFTKLAMAYVNGDEKKLEDPLVSPGLADWYGLFGATKKSGSELPPTLIQVGLRDLLLSDAVQLYHKMKQAAPAPGWVTISPYDGMWHAFQSAFGMPEADRAHEEMADFFVNALNGAFSSKSD